MTPFIHLREALIVEIDIPDNDNTDSVSPSPPSFLRDPVFIPPPDQSQNDKSPSSWSHGNSPPVDGDLHGHVSTKVPFGFQNVSDQGLNVSWTHLHDEYDTERKPFEIQ